LLRKIMLNRATSLGSLRGSPAALLHARTKAKSVSRDLLVQRALSVPGRIRLEHNRFHNRRETNFLLYEVEQIQDPEGDCAAVLDSVEKFIGEWHHLDPLLDKHPPQFVPAERTADGRNAVVVSEDAKRLISAYQDVGFSQLDQLGLPFAVQCCAAAMIGGAFSSNPFGVFTLTRCAADLLEAHGSERLKQKYLPNMRSGKWMGTMALSEPQAGSSLASIRTIATPYAGPEAEEGEYRIRGNKMWTSGAFHDLTENIVHMLLARTPGAPPGSRGISLFLVPNKLADGRHNDVEVISLNKKMGHRALSNCAWVLGERAGGAVGYLVGKENEGLQNMFFMMNAMRIEVGLSAASLGQRGFLESLLYAQVFFSLSFLIYF
jgi:alkylation response protein AidB-like acyl-CoA dehydrogenase